MIEPAAVIRRRMRKARSAVPAQYRRRLANRAAQRLASLGLLRCGGRIGIYLPFGGELPTQPLIEIAERRGCRVYVPRIIPSSAFRMTFVPLRGPYRRNRYGIDEPGSLQGSLTARWLDVVILPIVAFDASGTRIGSGAGYYDRALAHLALRKTWRKPVTVGFAYELQRVAALDRRSWDVPLPLIVTDAQVYRTQA